MYFLHISVSILVDKHICNFFNSKLLRFISKILFLKIWVRIKIVGVSKVTWVSNETLLALREAAYKINVIVQGK